MGEISHIKVEHRLRVFEKNVHRVILGLKGDEMVEGWRKVHNDELQTSYSSPSIIRMMKSGRCEGRI
jgi:hypothetical protein